MGVLSGTRVYTIGHMEFADGKDWRAKVKAALVPRGVTVFDPYHKPFINSTLEDDESRRKLLEWRTQGKFDLVGERVMKLRSEDLRLCDISDFIIGEIIPTVPSWGTAEEFFWSNRMKKPIFLSVVGGKKVCPAWIFGTIPHKYIYENMDAVIDILIKIDDGKVKLDSSRWRLLLPEYR